MVWFDLGTIAVSFSEVTDNGLVWFGVAMFCLVLDLSIVVSFSEGSDNFRVDVIGFLPTDNPCFVSLLCIVIEEFNLFINVESILDEISKFENLVSQQRRSWDFP